MNNTSKILIAFAAGAATGAVLGLLFAPSKGSELREKISDRGKKIYDEIGKKIEEGKDRLKEVREKIKECKTETCNL